MADSDLTAPLCCFDVDGTLDSDPPFFRWLIDAIHKAGGRTAILTGSTEATPAAVAAKRQRLAELGFENYGQLVVFPRDGIAEAKAKWCEANGAVVLIDNRKQNIKAASKVTLALMAWATKTK